MLYGNGDLVREHAKKNIHSNGGGNGRMVCQRFERVGNLVARSREVSIEDARDLYRGAPRGGGLTLRSVTYVV